ncbi:MAG TPA: J domain-containing protein [Pirellulales bacterium]|nr:J domain-containing protein [Pirellulales bacterium]
MSDPYEVLGLARGADEAEIRARYLQLVRAFPPDRAPERFAEVRAAFDELRDPSRRLIRQLFELRSRDSLEGLTADLRARLRNARPSTETLLSLAEAP